MVYGSFDSDEKSKNHVTRGNTLSLHTTDITVKNINNFDFSNINSLRSQLGVRYRYSMNDMTNLYADAAWEHEFAGKAIFSNASSYFKRLYEYD